MDGTLPGAGLSHISSVKESWVQSSRAGSRSFSFDFCFSLALALRSAFVLALLSICFLSCLSASVPIFLHREWNEASAFTGGGAILAKCEEQDSMTVLIFRTQEIH